MEKLLFKDWESLYHIAFCAFISYFVLFVFIRLARKRTFAKLTAFDFVVTITLGSTLSSMILNKVTITEGSIALVIIIALQYVLAFSAKKSKKLEEIINSKPTLLFYDGKFITDAMDKEVITKEEIYAEIRKFRLYRLEDVKAVVMELNGELTVVKKAELASKHHSLTDLSN